MSQTDTSSSEPEPEIAFAAGPITASTLAILFRRCAEAAARLAADHNDPTLTAKVRQGRLHPTGVVVEFWEVKT